MVTKVFSPIQVNFGDLGDSYICVTNTDFFVLGSKIFINFFLVVAPTKEPIVFQSKDVGKSPISIFEYVSAFDAFQTCKL